MWGLLSRQLGRDPHLVDTESAVSILNAELAKPSVRKWVNGEIFVHTLRTCRDWKGHIAQHAPVEFDSGLVILSVNFPVEANNVYSVYSADSPTKFQAWFAFRVYSKFSRIYED